jgi:hypothetical protein
MPTRPFRTLASLAVAFALVSLAASDASAQRLIPFDETNRRFYGSDYYVPGYADSLGLHGHARLENGGYYGPPQMYSRQWGTVHGYRIDRPFRRLRNGGDTIYAGPGS